MENTEYPMDLEQWSVDLQDALSQDLSPVFQEQEEGEKSNERYLRWIRSINK